MTMAPLIIRDARLAAAPYSMSSPKTGSGHMSRQPSNPPTRLLSRGPPLPTTAAAFGLPPSTASPAPATPLSYVPEIQDLQAAPQVATPASLAKVFPYLEKVSIEDPAVTPTSEGLVLEEWAAFKKQMINYNLSLELYKPDLDWKKEHMTEPSAPAELADYHLRIGCSNQRVGTVALMECIIGQYIHTVGAALVAKQAKMDNLQLTLDDIEWYLAQGAKEPEQLLSDERVPQEDLAPLLFLPRLMATPAPAAPTDLPAATPLSSLTLLPPTSPFKPTLPVVSELATPLVRTFEQFDEAQPTPKVAPMDISPPAGSMKAVPASPPTSATLAPIIGQLTPDAQMSEAQKAHIDEVLLEYKQQEQQALKELHAMCQWSRAAEVAIQLEQAKL